MLSMLVAALQTIDPDLTARDIADAIWLARHMGTSHTVTSSETNGSSSLADTRGSPSEPITPEKSSQTPAPEAAAYSLYPDAHEDQKSDEESQQLGILPFRSPAVVALTDALDIARALRPFRRQVPLLTKFVLDEEATAERSAQEGRWVPVLDYAQTRWLDVALVIDKGTSMAIWRQTIMEFHRLLARHGAFRDVRIWELDTNDKEGVYLYTGTGAGAQNRQPRSQLELIDASHRRLILVMTDCISPAWRSGTAAKILEKWGHYHPVTLVQVLPQLLWSRTALKRAAPIHLHTTSPGIPNIQFERQETNYWDKEKSQTGIPLPIVTLEPRPLANWAQVIARAEDTWIPGFTLATSPKEESVSPLLSAAERVQRFRANASPLAYRLAGLLTHVPISLPVIRLIQRTMMPMSDQIHLAEVFLGGLLKVASANSNTLDPDYVQYNFVDGVRELLLPLVPLGDTSRILGKIGDFIEENFGNALDFRALLANPLATEGISISKESLPFAMVAAKILPPLGGNYALLANRLEQAVSEALAQEQSVGLSVGAEKIASLKRVSGYGQVITSDKLGQDSTELESQEIIDSGKTVEDLPEIVESSGAQKAVEDDTIVGRIREAEIGEVRDEGYLFEEAEGVESTLVTGTIKIFISYAHKDEALFNEMVKFLSDLRLQMPIVYWYDRLIEPGTQWESEVRKYLDSAEIILLLISPDYMVSNYLQEIEVKRALERHIAGEVLIIPVLLRPVDDWQSILYGNKQALSESIQFLPMNGRPITSWSNRDEAFTEVLRGIQTIAKELTANPLPAILIAGPPNVGKSVLAYNLTRELRRREIPHYVFRANPDIEGDWFFEGDLETVRQTQLKVSVYRQWTDIFREFVCRDLAHRQLPLIVDLNGLPRDADNCIFEACTHSILLFEDGDEEATQAWRRYTTTNGLLPLAEFHSQLKGDSILTAEEPIITGTITGLERTARLHNRVFDALLERVCQLFSSITPDELEKFHLDRAPIKFRVHLPRQLQALVPDTDRWTAEMLRPLLAKLPAQTAMAVYGRAPIWVYGALALHAGTQPFHQFDVRLGWVTPPTLQASASGPLPQSLLYIKEENRNDAYVILIHPIHNYLDYREADQLVFPEPPRQRGVVVSGKLPLWLFTALARFYVQREVPWIALNDARDNRPIVIYSQVRSHRIGKILPKLA